MLVGFYLVIILLALVGIAMVIFSVLDKGMQISNPIRKDNSDYRFTEVDNIKTRNIFEPKSVVEENDEGNMV